MKKTHPRKTSHSVKCKRFVTCGNEGLYCNVIIFSLTILFSSSRGTVSDIFFLFTKTLIYALHKVMLYSYKKIYERKCNKYLVKINVTIIRSVENKCKIILYKNISYLARIRKISSSTVGTLFVRIFCIK